MRSSKQVASMIPVLSTKTASATSGVFIDQLHDILRDAD